MRGRPPVPVELVHPLGRAASDRADRERRQERRRAGRVVRVAGHAGDLHLLVDPLVVRLHLLVGDGPVVGEPVERAELVVLRAQPHPLGAEVHRAAADRVVHDRRDRRARDLERVVGGCCRVFGFGLHCASATSSHSSLSPGKSAAFSQPPCSRQTTLKPASARWRAATEPPAPAPTMRTSALAPLPEIENESGAAGSTGSGGGGGVVLMRPARVDRVEEPVAQVVLGLVGEGRPLALARVADPLPDLEVHVVAARGDLGERREPVGSSACSRGASASGSRPAAASSTAASGSTRSGRARSAPGRATSRPSPPRWPRASRPWPG